MFEYLVIQCCSVGVPEASLNGTEKFYSIPGLGSIFNFKQQINNNNNKIITPTDFKSDMFNKIKNQH